MTMNTTDPSRPVTTRTDIFTRTGIERLASELHAAIDYALMRDAAFRAAGDPRGYPEDLWHEVDRTFTSWMRAALTRPT